MARFGFMVVKGLGERSTGTDVAAMKNVLLPPEGFPTIPISMEMG
jgi:hypothetical protein